MNKSTEILYATSTEPKITPASTPSNGENQPPLSETSVNQGNYIPQPAAAEMNGSTDILYATSTQPKTTPASTPSNGENQPPQSAASINQGNHKPQPKVTYYIVQAKAVKQGVLYFSEASIRRAFIKKVFSIVSIQLLITMALTCWFLFEEHTKRFVQENLILLLVAFAINIIVLLALACFGQLRRKAPTNYILLFIFTVSEAFLVATLASFFDVIAVVLAVGFTTLVCLGLCLFAFQTKWDFTTLGGLLFVSLLVLIFMGIASIFLYSQIFQVLYAGAGAIIFSLYFVYDIQLMMGGRHRYKISPEEYIFAAINLFLDIINIFMYILRIVGIAGR